MPRLEVGQTMPDFTFDTPFEQNIRFSDAARGRTAAIAFLRYYGCTLCQYMIHLYKTQYEKIVGAGGTLFVVLQSAPATLRAELAPGDLPFDIICDPDMKLYKAFEIPAGESKEQLLGGTAMEKIAAARESFEHGAYEGEEMQLPATFVVGDGMQILYAHYGEDIGDSPTPDEFAEILRGVRA